jgi:hypothetical protein
VFNPRNALVLGIIFVAVGAGYLLLQGDGQYLDRAGALMLVMLGVAMGFGFLVLLRGSREL